MVENFSEVLSQVCDLCREKGLSLHFVLDLLSVE